MILYPHQLEAIKELKTGSILWGGVGSGKSLAAILYYYENEYPKNLYVITTAKKRDSKDWEDECNKTDLVTKDPFLETFVVDSWNNIKKYVEVKNAFFIFDEQRVVGSGVWVKSFLKIAKKNDWILLSATPGDTWMDYVPVFIANGFYKNRTMFIRRHVVYNSFVMFPKVDRYLEVDRLQRLKKAVMVEMKHIEPAITKRKIVNVTFDKALYKKVVKDRWNPYTESPIKNVSELFFVTRRVVNSDISRLVKIITLVQKHSKVIVFYNFNYELKILRSLSNITDISVAEYNGHKHESIPDSQKWVYLVQYTAGSEGWNCIETNTIVFYSQSYSYRVMKQAAGRINRINTPFGTLFYYHLVSDSTIDKAIKKALRRKKKFNESNFYSQNKQGL